MKHLHLSDDQLMESYVLAEASTHDHLTSCRECQSRFDELARALEHIREDALRHADAVFTSDRLHDQHDRVLRRLERQGHPAEVVMFPMRSGGQQAARRLLGPARRWIAGAAAAGLVAGLFLGFAVDRRMDPASAVVAVRALAGSAAAEWQPVMPSPQDEQILTEIEDALTGVRRVIELRAIDAMTTPPEFQEASFVSR